MAYGRVLRLDGSMVWRLGLLGLLLACAAVPSLDTVRSWEATSYAGWPGVGLSVVLFLSVWDRGPRATAALWAVQTAGLGLVLGATYDVGWVLGMVGSVAVTVPALITARWVRPGTAPFRRFNEGEVDAYHGVTAIAGAVCAGLTMLAAVAAGRGDLTQVLMTGLISFFAATTAQLIVVPFWLRSADGWSRLHTSGEMWGQRLMLAVFVAAIFCTANTPPMAFLLFPILGWTAIRAAAPETHIQVALVSVVAFVATLTGRGPLAIDSLNDPGPFSTLLVYAFIASICYLLIPLALTVERLTSVTRQATRAAATVGSMLDSATGTVFIATDPAGIITHYSPGAERALGFRAAEIVGRHSATLHSPAEVTRQTAARANSAGTSAVAVSGVSVSGDAVSGVAVSGDAVSGVAVINSASDPSPDDSSGGSRGEMATHITEYRRAVAAQITDGSRVDWAFIHCDGGERLVSLTINAMTERGRVVGYIASGEDITDRVNTQRALEQALRREVASVEALRAADEVKQELVSTVSHELRTPITNITGFTEVLIDGELGELGPHQIKAMERIQRNSERLHDLVDDLLVLSRVESDANNDLDTSEATEILDLNDLATTARDLVQRSMRARDLHVDLQLSPTPVLVTGNRHMLERVIINLWSNAIKFTPDGGSIQVRTACSNNDAEVAATRAHATPAPGPAGSRTATLSVRDTGIGIAPEEHDAVFERFYRTSAAGKRAIQGSGLGLSIVKAIIDQHHGTIHLTSQPGEGTTITIDLPTADDWWQGKNLAAPASDRASQ